jgi:excisionase family DNA binding protein
MENTEYLTTKEIADQLKVNVLTIRRWIGAGKLKAISTGKIYRIRKEDFEKLIKSMEVKN